MPCSSSESLDCTCLRQPGSRLNASALNKEKERREQAQGQGKGGRVREAFGWDVAHHSCASKTFQDGNGNSGRGQNRLGTFHTFWYSSTHFHTFSEFILQDFFLELRVLLLF